MSSPQQINWRVKILGLTWVGKMIAEINLKLEKIMATQQELAQQLNDIGTQLGKVDTEVQNLLAKIADLEAQLQNAQVTPELQAAFDAVKIAAQKVDDEVPDAPAGG